MRPVDVGRWLCRYPRLLELEVLKVETQGSGQGLPEGPLYLTRLVAPSTLALIHHECIESIHLPNV